MMMKTNTNQSVNDFKSIAQNAQRFFIVLCTKPAIILIRNETNLPLGDTVCLSQQTNGKNRTTPRLIQTVNLSYHNKH